MRGARAHTIHKAVGVFVENAARTATYEGDTGEKAGRIRLPRKTSGYTELAEFFDRHDGTDLLDQEITEIDPDCTDLGRMLREWSECG